MHSYADLCIIPDLVFVDLSRHDIQSLELASSKKIYCCGLNAPLIQQQDANCRFIYLCTRIVISELGPGVFSYSVVPVVVQDVVVPTYGVSGRFPTL